ncbi:hypothetical protein [Microbacterium esteraromaticum]|uniref:hypothetical protein n=1 Tax=Microbacterium esteraromaticum TaxID=57043 RepID=UPI0019D32BFB|nr:hypothetical protein [Microbacterium esteraromaticum]MBN7792448.1 hypothetical protein [Microbacterium esteraromaticum]
MKRSLLCGLSAVAVAILLAGCSAGEDMPVPVAETPAADGAGTTLEDLRAMYVQAGGECESPSPRGESAVAEEAADCEDGALLTTYKSTARRDGAISLLQGAQDSNPSPHIIAVGADWIVNSGAAAEVALKMGGETLQIGVPRDEPAPVEPDFDLTTDDGLCAADAEMSNLELNDAIAPMLGYSADRDDRTFEQDEAIREHKNAAFERACPERAG